VPAALLLELSSVLALRGRRLVIDVALGTGHAAFRNMEPDAADEARRSRKLVDASQARQGRSRQDAKPHAERR
jgi:hypothetical protein